MLSYTFKVITRDTNQSNLYNIFSSSVVDSQYGFRYTQVVNEGEECRLDLFCNRIYGTSLYVEELMMINNIINPFSISVGDTLYYVDLTSLRYFNKVDDDSATITNKINVSSKSTRVDPTRQTGVPPTIRPVDFKQIIVDKNSQTIKLNTKLS